MAKIDDLLSEYARAITNDRIDGVTITRAQSERIKAARFALIDYITGSAAECAVCKKPIRPAVWCSIACMEKAIGPMQPSATEGATQAAFRNDVAATTMPCPVACGGVVRVGSSTCAECGASINVQRIT